MNKLDLQVKNIVSLALQEDIGEGDVTSALLPASLQVEAAIISREPMVVCGQPWVNEVFHQVDEKIKIEWVIAETDWLENPTTLCTIYGSARSILTAERTALNFLQTLSATATQTSYYVQKLHGTQTRLLDTRKTLPGLRVAQKYAVTCGGGLNHRMGLFDAFLIKENHIKACGSIAQAIALARQTHKNILVEIEVETIAELNEAIAARPDRILLDNFNHDMLNEAIRINTPKMCSLEVSGGVTPENIASIAQLGVDFISVGAITKSIEAIDLSLLIRDTL